MKTIIDTATDAGKFTTLLNALKAAALTETLRGAGPFGTLEGTPLLAALVDGKVTVNGAKVVQADIDASNGVIHAIDAVIMPKGVMLAAAA